ncbi:Aspartyl protease family protein-like protein [Drosera capensis]
MAKFSSTVIVFLCICSFGLLSVEVAVTGRNLGHEDETGTLHDHYHHVKVSSLLPRESCMSSSKGQKQDATMEVVHSYGPCSKRNPDETTNPSHSELLERDEARVKYIHSRVSLPTVDKVAASAVTLPAKSGISIGSGNYLVPVGLGTPARKLYLVFDTGSSLTWTQCQPCAGTCYSQVDAIFNPSASSTYTNISCSSAACASISSATSTLPGCSGSTCVYGIRYGDSSFSMGWYGTETLTLTPGHVFPNFKFGCGENNQGFTGSDGLLGLGRDQVSAFSQVAAKYGRYFSYCLPTRSGSGGSLTFGDSGSASSATVYTPLLSSYQYPSFYFVRLQGISVGGIKLSISPSVFSTAGTIIDSGTVITRLPPAAYSALKSTFTRIMSNYGYPTASALSILDTCYDFSSYSRITVPAISLLFNNGAQWRFGFPGILYVVSISQVCLAFAGNSDPSSFGILGNTQQQTFNVIYDVDNGRLGFGPGSCN